jgi:hypothetical protein
MQMAIDDLAKQDFKIPFNVQLLQGQGYTPPELPSIDVDKIKGILAERTRQATPQVVVVQQGQPQLPVGPGGQINPVSPGGGAVPAGMARYDHRQGLVSFSYPQNWQMQQAIAQVGNTFSVGDPNGVAVQVYEVPNVSDPNVAMNMIAQAIGQFGSQVTVQDARAQGNATLIQGTTVGPGGYYQWQGVFRAVPGGVIGIVAGAPSASFQSSRPAFEQILGTVRFQQ